MSTDPTGRTYGSLDQAMAWSCGYGKTETSPPCMDPAVWHGVILGDRSEPRLQAAMASCDQHRAVMALSADWVHVMGSACQLPGSKFIWPENECVMPEGDGLLALTEHAEVPGV